MVKAKAINVEASISPITTNTANTANTSSIVNGTKWSGNGHQYGDIDILFLHIDAMAKRIDMLEQLVINNHTNQSAQPTLQHNFRTLSTYSDRFKASNQKGNAGSDYETNDLALAKGRESFPTVPSNFAPRYLRKNTNDKLAEHLEQLINEVRGLKNGSCYKQELQNGGDVVEINEFEERESCLQGEGYGHLEHMHGGQLALNPLCNAPINKKAARRGTIA